LALGFAALVNMTVVASLVWTELFPDAVRKAAWLAVAVVWVGSATVARWRDRAAARQADEPQTGDPYCQAVEHYLKGDWFEAECALAALLRANPRDVDANLMLATLYRHTGRPDEAAVQLDRIERLDESAKWVLEIDRERKWLAEKEPEPPADP
jgi:predicted Zn-dependent protease